MPPSRLLPLLLLLASLLVVGGALLSQYVGGLTPCELCLYERWPYYTIIPVMILALAVGGRGFSRAVFLLAGLVFLASCGLAFYHVGVEQHWFAGPTACTTPQGAAQSLDALTAQLLGQKPVQCDQVQWSFLGISLAGFNLLASIMLTLYSLWACRALGRNRP